MWSSQVGEPVWELAELFPLQGAWTEEDYFSLDTMRLIEYTHGYISVLPWPTTSHQSIVGKMAFAVREFLKHWSPQSEALFAPLPMRLWPGKYREPDIVVMLAAHADRRHEQYWDTPDLVMEVVSPEYRRLDLEIKRREYARAGIPEYWIVDPETAQITVLTLHAEHYKVQGAFGRSEVATSVLLNGFEVKVDEVWAATEH